MKNPNILFISDIHCEFHKDYGQAFIQNINKHKTADIAVIAGDLTTSNLFKKIAPVLSYAFEETVFIVGNHEYYHSSFGETRIKIESAIKHYPNVHWLHNSDIALFGIKIAGTPLWFKNDASNRQYKHLMNDFQMISGFEKNVYNENKKSIDFLENITNNNIYYDIMVTHHLPSQRFVLDRYKDDDLNRFFVCEVDDLIERLSPKIWLFGHTHNSFDQEMGPTRFICNPYGYMRYEENPDFKENLIITMR